MSKDGVNGTPTVLVDGEMQSEATLQASIDAALGGDRLIAPPVGSSRPSLPDSRG